MARLSDFFGGDAPIDDNTVSSDTLWSSQKVQNELSGIDLTDLIDDNTVGTTNVWSSQKVQDELNSVDVTDVIDDSSVSSNTVWSSIKLVRWVPLSVSNTLYTRTKYAIDFTSGPLTLTLPSNPSENDFIEIIASNGSSENSTIQRNGHTIENIAENLTIDYSASWIRLVFVNNNWTVASS